MAEIVLINKAKGSFTINFMGAFPQNKMVARNGKVYLTEKEYEWLKNAFPNVLEGENKRLFLESELAEADDKVDNEKFFAQKAAKIKSAIAKMDEEELEEKYQYAQLNEVSNAIVKVIEDRILELDKAKE